MIRPASLLRSDSDRPREFSAPVSNVKEGNQIFNTFYLIHISTENIIQTNHLYYL